LEKGGRKGGKKKRMRSSFAHRRHKRESQVGVIPSCVTGGGKKKKKGIQWFSWCMAAGPQQRKKAGVRKKEGRKTFSIVFSVQARRKRSIPLGVFLGKGGGEGKTLSISVPRGRGLGRQQQQEERSGNYLHLGGKRGERVKPSTP